MVNDGVRLLDAGVRRQQCLVTGSEGTAPAIAFDEHGGPKPVVDADRIFDHCLDDRDLVNCADTLGGHPAKAARLADHAVEPRCTAADFSPVNPSLLSRLRVFLGGLFQPFSPGIWWIGLGMDRSGSGVQIRQYIHRA